ncbi:MAG: hypothetical protein U9O89_04435 [Thermoproteota archaeon]|nr:hypothetical protein [Thermoproteota archaeon]
MLTTTDILTIIEEENPNIKQLTKKLEIPPEQLEKILKDLSDYNLVEYNQQSGKVKLPSWLLNINKEIKNIKPTTGTIILPKNQEIKIQDITLGNFTKNNLELNIRLKAKKKEIAICKIT